MTIRSISKYICMALLGLEAMSASAQAWWNNDWTVRKKITVDASSKGVAITDPVGGSVAVLVRLHEADFQFAAAREDGSDLRFVSEDEKTVLTHHLEKFDGLLGEAFAWVKVPEVKPGEATSFWLYYGNQGNSGVKLEDAKATYDVDTVLVYHFNEKGTAPADFSIPGNNAQSAGAAVEGAMIGRGLKLAGKTAVSVPASPSLLWKAGGAATLSFWIKPSAPVPEAVILSRREGANSFVVGLSNGVPYVAVAAGGAAQKSGAGAALAPGAWKHLSVVAEAGGIQLLVDGEPYASLAAGLPALNGPLTIGGDTAGGEGFVGEMDELQIAKVARPAGFLKMVAYGQGGEKAGRLVVLGADEQASTWMSGTFGILMRSLTVDGWVVIGVLAVMAVISWWVMVIKTSYLNANAKGNALFMSEWRHLAADLTALDHGDPDKVRSVGGRVDSDAEKLLRHASVYRIYHIGAEEIRHRVAGDAAPDTRVLSARSIQAIRASMDAGMVRETQKLNQLMVFLTIAISGGPFLGLLGTVVGVMITFAAIAAAGDVNVNAIAPGIAAALVATVAGLVVAIPALFGYNYLTSRVKEASNDMHVFVDEFVTKMAEFYGDENMVDIGGH